LWLGDGAQGGAREHVRPLAWTFASVLLVVALLVPRTAAAQMGDSLASVGAEVYPWARDLGNARTQARLQVLRADVTAPLPVGARTLLLARVTYEQIDVDLRGEPARAPAPTLRSPALSLGVVQKIGPRWTVIALAGAGLASDFSEPVSKDDVLVTVTGIVVYKVSDAFSLGAGALYDRRTGSPTPLPAFILNWRPAQDFRVRGFVPARLDAEFRASPHVTAGVRAALNGNRYQLGERAYGVEGLQVAYSTVTVGPKLTLSASDWLHLDLYAAAAVYRRYDVFHSGDDAGGVSLAPVVAYGLRFWFGPSMWEPPRAAE
jgi:hypothetical protein